MPTYTGEPLSTWTHLTAASRGLPNTAPGIWRWDANRTVVMHSELDIISTLVARGYEQVDVSEPQRLTCLTSQLCDVQFVGTVDRSQPWARTEDIEYVNQYPVQLLFPIPSNDPPLRDTTSLQMLHFVPPPHMGSMAMVADKEDLSKSGLYISDQLPEQGQTFCRQLSAALKELAAPASSDQIVIHQSIMPSLATERSYRQSVRNMHSYILTTNDNEERAKLRQVLEALPVARQQIVAVQQSFEKSDWQAQWERIQRMARDLAADYFALHLNTKQEKSLPQITDVFHAGYSEVLTSQPFQVYSYASIAPKTAWQEVPSGQEHEIILAYQRTKKKGTTVVQIRGDATGQNRELVLTNLSKQVNRLSDLDSDVFLAMIGQLLKGNRDEGGNCWITAQQILDYRDKKHIRKEIGAKGSGIFRKAGVRGEDKEEISQCISSMENTWIRVQEDVVDDDSAGTGKSRKRHKFTRESRLFIFGDIIYHQELSMDGTPGRRYPVAWQYRESNWMLPYLEGPNRFTAALLQKTLSYDWHNEFWEKRLAKHFMFYLRTNARWHETNPLIIQNLFDELNLPIDWRNPERTKQRFEKAMNRLQEDGHVVWNYKGEVKLPARKWIQTWLQLQIEVEDHPSSPNKALNQSIETHAKVVNSQNHIERKSRKRKQDRKKE